ncbi:MAG: universal stress protein [Prolixibacteraceae bacterium]|nr:universal stress protein [Prolixibacteraceae bacterium]
MKKKFLPIATLPFVKAQQLKNLLEQHSIECKREDINIGNGASSLSSSVKVTDAKMERAFLILEDFLKTPSEKKLEDEKERLILIPVDYSDYSFGAAKAAFGMAGRLSAKMVLFHVYPNPITYSVPFSDMYAYDMGLHEHLENSDKHAQESMNRFVNRLIDNIGMKNWENTVTEYIIKAGDVREDILSYAHANRALMIVMGSLGKAASEIDILGSVTAEIIIDAKLPVLVIPPDTPADFAANFKEILYATNFDEKDFVAIDKLMRIVKSHRVNVHFIHMSRNEEAMWDLARLEGMKEILQEKYRQKSFDCQLIVGEDLLNELDKFIDVNNIDVIALTTRKKSMIARIFNPSIARKMLFHTKIPLLVFHA